MRVLLGGLVGALCAVIWLVVATVAPTGILVFGFLAGMFWAATHNPVRT